MAHQVEGNYQRLRRQRSTSTRYEVNPDCTGKVELTLQTPSGPVTLTARFVIVNLLAVRRYARPQVRPRPAHGSAPRTFLSNPPKYEQTA
jgi:hypothetical protein